MQDDARRGGKGDQLGIVQDISILLCWQKIYVLITYISYLIDDLLYSLFYLVKIIFFSKIVS